MTRPLVSVVVPVRNAERFVGAALGSILMQEDLPDDAIEVVVVDNGSTDRSRDVVRAHLRGGDLLLHEPVPGAAAARNLGIRHAAGEFLAFLDADDLWTPHTLRQQLDALAGDPALDLVFGHYVSVDVSGIAHDSAQALPGYSLGTMLARRHRFLDVGFLSTTFAVGEFIDWYARAEEAGLRHAMLPAVLLHRRVHGGNTTARTAAGARADYARIVRLVAARRGRLEQAP